jgi:membrane protease YdiL (CAAX protease family)
VIQTEPVTPPGATDTHTVTYPPVPDRHRHGAIARLVRRRPLVSFFVLAFALTWITVPFGTFMAAGPLLAALVVTGVVAGRPGLRDLGRRMIAWRLSWHWYVAALAVPLAVALAAGGITVAVGGQGSAFAQLELSALALTFALRIVVPVFAPLGEEPGWRGFALPRLQARHSSFGATLVLGVVVALWHVPLVFIATENFEPVLLIGTVAVTFFYTWLFNHTDGSVFITMVAHAADGLIGPALVDDHGFTGANVGRYALWYTVGWIVVALVLLATDRAMWRTRQAGDLVIDDDGARPRTAGAARRAAPLVASAVASIVLLAAVTTSAAAATAPSRDTYIDRADAICDATVKKTDRVVEDLGFEGRKAATRIVALARSEVRELRSLTPPKGDAAAVTKIYDAIDRGFDRIEADPSVIDDEPGPLARATKLAKAYGLEVCGRG